MLIWINGAFGAGKTTTAFELHRRLAASHVADPELIGIGIHRMMPAAARGDFQDLPQWRSAVIATLADADAALQVASPGGVTIVPMTLVEDSYFDEIMTGLHRRGVEVHHFALTASTQTLRRRLHARSGYGIGRAIGLDERWAVQQIDRCTTALATDRYARQIDTDAWAVDDVVETIAAHVGLALTTPRLSGTRRVLHRASVTLRHVHF